jgi:hypothetical protein
VVGSVQRRQQQKWNAQDAAAAQAAAAQQAAAAPPPAAPSPVPAPAGSQSLLDQPAQLGQLRDSGVLTPEEFEAQKQRLLGS